METESDSKLTFPDIAVSREPDSRLTTSVYRKPTHTDQYLAYDSHKPQSVNSGIVKCLYDCTKPIVTKPSFISKTKKPLSSVLVCNGYQLPSPEKQDTSTEHMTEFKTTEGLPYIKGLSEQLCRCLQHEG